MHMNYASAASATTWVLTVVTGGVLQHVDTLTGWTVLALLAGGPAYLLFTWQMGPAQTLSQSIQKELR
jgi:hypothetical protein